MPPETWPNHAASRTVRCRPHDWHVQVAGDGPRTLLLLHGAGGATQSWFGLLPRLAERYRVVAPDLPGQGHSRRGLGRRASLDAMAEDVAALCAQEGWAPDAIVAHSAGVPLALRMVETGSPARAVVGMNAALAPFDGVAGVAFPIMAKLLAMNPLTPWMVGAFSGSRGRVAELLRSTGSQIDPQMLDRYHALANDRAHVSGTLAMMADWSLEGLLGRLGGIDRPVLLLAGDRDGTVPPEVSARAAERLPGARLERLEGLGHLAHEEAPERVAAAVTGYLDPILCPVGATG